MYMTDIAPKSRFRSVLDMVASACTIGIAALAVVVVYRGGVLGGAVQAPRQQAKPRPEPPVPTTPVSLTGANTRGSATAKVALIEYSDFECPYCGKFARETLPTIEKEFVDKGSVLFAFRHLPLERIHTHALGAATAAECAAMQGQFWAAHDYLFQHQDRLAKDDVVQAAASLNLDPRALAGCIDAATPARKIKADTESADQLQISGTPAFFLGTITADGKVRVMQRLSGAQPVETFRQVLQTLLTSAGDRKGN